jgi:hypothetical protein
VIAVGERTGGGDRGGGLVDERIISVPRDLDGQEFGEEANPILASK